MTKLRPFVPPQAPRSAVSTSHAPAFPRSSAAVTASCKNRPFTPPPLVSHQPSIDLQSMLDKAQREVDALQEKSVEQSATLEEERARVQSALHVIEQARANATKLLAKDAVMLGVEIGHALARGAFEVDSTRLVTLVESCLEEFSTEQPIQVHVAQADAAGLRDHLASQGSTNIEVHADEKLVQGDLTVEAEALVIDARLSERVQLLRDELATTVRADEALEPEAEDAP